MTFRESFITSLRAAGVPDGLVLDALLVAEASERARRAAARAAKMNNPDSVRPAESGLAAVAAAPIASVGGPMKDRARRGVLLGNKLKPAEQAVSAVLIERFNLTSGRCDPGIADIAAKAGFSVRSVTRALAELHKRGLIVRVIHGAGRTNAYRPDWDALAALAAWPAANVAKPDSGATRTLVATKPDTGVRQNYQGNIKPPVREEKSKREPDHRQRSLPLMSVVVGTPQAAVAHEQATIRVVQALNGHLSRFGPRFAAAARAEIGEDVLAKAVAAEMAKRGTGLQLVLEALGPGASSDKREAG